MLKKVNKDIAYCFYTSVIEKCKTCKRNLSNYKTTKEFVWHCLAKPNRKSNKCNLWEAIK